VDEPLQAGVVASGPAPVAFIGARHSSFPLVLMFLPFILLPRQTGEGREGDSLSRVVGRLQIMICNRRCRARRLPPTRPPPCDGEEKDDDRPSFIPVGRPAVMNWSGALR
jgi:hypothetical protein